MLYQVREKFHCTSMFVTFALLSSCLHPCFSKPPQSTQRANICHVRVLTSAFFLLLLSSPHVPLASLVLSLSLFSTRLSRWQSCHHGVQSHSGHSDPQQSRASGCCLNGPAAPLPQWGSRGPSPTPGFSADRHTDPRHCSDHDSPPRSEGGESIKERKKWWQNGGKKVKRGRSVTPI